MTACTLPRHERAVHDVQSELPLTAFGGKEVGRIVRSSEQLRPGKISRLRLALAPPWALTLLPHSLLGKPSDTIGEEAIINGAVRLRP